MMRPTTLLATFAVIGWGAAAHASSVLPQLAKINPTGLTKQSSLKGDTSMAIKKKADEILSLTEKARQVTRKIGELASSSVGNNSSESVDALQAMLDELKEINNRLERLETEVTDLKGWVEGQNESLPIIAENVSSLLKNRNTNYIQFQYRDTGARIGGNAAGRGKQHSFALRRIRVGLQQTIDPKTSIRTSFDLATGTDNTSLQLRDAILEYDIEPSDVQVGLQLTAGQQAIPIGYELSRSSREREFPERATYNRIMWDGERNRSLVLTKGLGPNSLVQLGAGTALTINDPEQRSRANTLKMAGYGAFRTYGESYDFGISYFQGEREGFTQASVAHPEITRRYWYADASIVDLLGTGLLLRAEAMMGSDRRPINRTATTGPSTPQGAVDMSGYQVQLGYNLNSRNQIFGRYAVSDFNTDSDNNAVREYGLVYRYYINQGASLTLSYEVFEDGAFSGAGRNGDKFNVTTIRYQFRF